MEKEKYTLEYIFRASPKMIYERISTASGLSEWFADDDNIKGNTYAFIWDGQEQIAEILSKKDNQYIKFHWVDDEDENAYFEFRIVVDELTEEVALLITDFAEDEDEKEENIDLWEAQVEDLHQVLGY